jgi:hypothetical protein
MSLKRHGPIVLGVFAVATVAVTLAAPASSAPRPPTVKPVIGLPVATPAQPMPGQRFTVAFKVTRSDTHKPLVRGAMICDPSVAGVVIPHAESFKTGTARLAFVIPTVAAGKQLKVKVTIKVDRQATTRIAMFPIASFPKLSAGDISVAEGNAATATLAFPVTLSAASSQVVSVGYATADATATAGTDYAAAQGTLTFKPGETAKTIPVSVTGDTAVEQDETLTLTLTNPVGATILDGSATGTITNDDFAPRSGHYAGTTSQGRSITFDVASDLTNLTNLQFFVDMSCPSAGLSIPAVGVDAAHGLLPGTIGLAADWSFGLSYPANDSNASRTIALNGKLTAPGSASGTVRYDIDIFDVPGLGTVHCSSGDVTWNAQ